MHGVNYKRERENEKRGEIGMVKQEEERKEGIEGGAKGEIPWDRKIYMELQTGKKIRVR